MRSVYRTVWEIPQKALVDMAAERGPFIDQSQSLNLFIEPPTVTKVHDTQVEWRFRMTAPAAREFLQRVSRLEMAGPASGSKVARSP